MSQEIKIGLIGAGKWGVNYLNTIKNAEGVAIKKIACKSLSGKESLLRDYEITDKWQELIFSSEIDGIIIAFESMKPGENEIYNIGYGERVQLMDFVREIEKNLGREANIRYSPMHPADNKDTWSDTTKLQALGYKPKVSIEEGVAKFVEWYKSYYKVN